MKDRWVKRFTIGFAQDKSRFAPVPGNVPTDPVPPDRILVYPWVGVPLFEDVFEKAKNRGQIGSRFETTDSSTLLVDRTADGWLGSGSVRDTTRYTLTWRFP